MSKLNGGDHPPEFVPGNRLEEMLMDAQRRDMEPVAFMRELVNSRVHILVDQELAESEDPGGAKPLLLETPDGRVLMAAFSTVERAAPMTQQNPEFSFTVEVDFAWVVAVVAREMGIVLNPGSDYGFEMPPESIAALKRDVEK